MQNHPDVPHEARHCQTKMPPELERQYGAAPQHELCAQL